jgi:adenosine deaminase
VTEVRALALNAVQAAWLEESSRTQLRREFEEEIEALTRTCSAS